MLYKPWVLVDRVRQAVPKDQVDPTTHGRISIIREHRHRCGSQL
jgi:hypothetical protein